MHYGTSVAGRTRSRLSPIVKQDLEKKNQSKERDCGEEFGSDYTSEEEGLSVDSESDDVLFIEERDVDTIPVDENDVLVIEESDVDTIPGDDDDDDDDDVLFTGERDEGSRPGKGVEDVERSQYSGERNPIECRLKRKKMYGLDCTHENAVQERRCVAQRTRSHFSSKLGKSKLKLGTFSHPLCVDEEEEESESLSVQGGLSDEGGKINHVRRKTKATKKKSDSCDGVNNRIVDDNHGEYFYGKCVSESDEEYISGDESEDPDCKQRSHNKGEPGKRKRKKHKADPKDFDAVKILQDSLGGEGEVPLEKFASSSDEEGNPRVRETRLPLKFTFGTKESKPPEKSEDEKELGKLWDEMDECLCASENDSGQVENDHVYDPCPVDEVSRDTSGQKNVSRAALCQQGEHYLILNEELGLTCKYCSHVSLEIQYYDPPFSKNPWGSSDRRDSCTLDNADHPVFNDLQHEISGRDDDPSGYDPHMSTGTVWDIIPGVKKSMFPHQCEAFEFLWANLAGGILLDKLKEHLNFASGSGCIISHAPGTGKTRLTIVFLQAFLGLYPTCRPMIIAPSNMLLTWEEEFEKWKVGIPFHNLNKPEYSGKESEVAMSLLRQSGCHVHRKSSIRLVKLYSWKKDRSILGISYTLFEKLARQSSDDKVIKKALLELPGLLVLDEGHTPRNAQSLIWKALSKIKTKRRIILSGTPFQNNFAELYNTLCLVKPEFAEWNSSGNRVVVDEKRGSGRNETGRKLAYLFNSIGKVKSDREKDKILEDIRTMIKPFVHLHEGNVLQQSLPGLRELVVILKPTQTQKVLLDEIQKTRKSHLKGEKSNLLKLDHLESITAVHPSLCLVAEDKDKLERLSLNPEDGFKTKFLIELIRLCEVMKEKVLVFSQFIDPLTFLRDQFKSHFSWTEGREVLQMHGKFDVKTRQASIKAFNDPTSKVRVLLASTKACFEGISLVGASRVVLLDVVWNPSVERQAVSRAYRLGQRKVVYTYHLITSGTRDEQKCSSQAEKDQFSKLVFFYSGGAGHQQNISTADLEDKIFEKMVHNENFRHIFEKVATNKRTLL